MTIADDLVAAIPPLLLSQEAEDIARAAGAMFAEVEDYAMDPDEPDPTPVFVNRLNYFPNPSFEQDQPGAAPAALGYDGGGGTVTVFDVEAGWASDGVRALHITATGVPATSAVTVIPGQSAYAPVSPGELVSARAVFNSLNTHTTPDLALRFFDANLVQLIQVDTVGPVNAIGEIDVIDVVAPAQAAWVQAFPALHNATGAAQTLDGKVDGVELFLGGPVPSGGPWTGDSPGWEWTGAPGASWSAPVPPLPQVGWGKMLDIDAADTKGLPYLAQWVGERLPTGISDAAAREWIRRAPNQNRGQLSAIAQGIMPLLTGTKSVFTRERSKVDGTVASNWLAVLTFANETPNITRVANQLRRKLVPADILLDYQVITARTWTAIEQPSGVTWATLETGASTWSSLESAGPGFIPAGFLLWTP